jgi:hypothetical protein
MQEEQEVVYSLMADVALLDAPEDKEVIEEELPN